MIDLVYLPGQTGFDLLGRVGFFLTGLAISIHFLCNANFLRRAPFIVKGVLLPLAAGSGMAMLMGAVAGRMDLCFHSAAFAAAAMIALDVSAWYSGVKLGETYDRRAAITNGEPFVHIEHRAPFEMHYEVGAALRRLRKVSAVAALVAGAGLLTGYPQQFFSALTDNAPAVGYHTVTVNTPEVVRGERLQVTWNVERTRVCRAGFRTWIVDANGTEHLLDLSVNNPPVNTRPEPGVVHAYKKEYTIPATAAPGPAYITASVWHACNPVRAALKVYRHVYYERAAFFIKAN